MATYIVLNVAVLACCLFVCRAWLRRPSKAWLVMLGMLIALTAVFDSAIIAAHIVGYDSTKILGVYVGKAPIEDFLYALLAAVVVPVIWNKSEGRRSV
jgi:lycopene cyclase domain-containing protein